MFWLANSASSDLKVLQLKKNVEPKSRTNLAALFRVCTYVSNMVINKYWRRVIIICWRPADVLFAKAKHFCKYINFWSAWPSLKSQYSEVHKFSDCVSMEFPSLLFSITFASHFDNQEERSAISQPRVLIMSRLNSGPPDKKGRNNSVNG